jgi:hypothetical protein
MATANERVALRNRAALSMHSTFAMPTQRVKGPVVSGPGGAARPQAEPAQARPAPLPDVSHQLNPGIASSDWYWDNTLRYCASASNSLRARPFCPQGWTTGANNHSSPPSA